MALPNLKVGKFQTIIDPPLSWQVYEMLVS